MKTQAQYGWMGPDAEEIIVTNRTGSAVALGDVERLDNTRVDAASTTNAPGLATSGLANIVVPLLGNAKGHYLATGIFGVVQSSAADDFPCRFRLRGYCEAVQCTGSVTITTFIGIIQTAKESITAGVNDLTTLDGQAPHKVVFIPLTNRTGAGTTDGWFDGVHGFGTILSVTGLT